MEVKILENFDPKVVFHFSLICKNYHFRVSALIVWNPCTHDRAQLNVHHVHTRGMMEKHVFENCDQLENQLWGEKFSDFLNPKKCPLYGRKIGENFFLISQG